MTVADAPLIGIGLYTLREAARLIHVPVAKLGRWLRGHEVQGRHYDPLWHPQVNIGDGKLYLSFRDLLEARVAARLIEMGFSPQKVRLAILLATEMVGEHPLSTTWLRTDGRRLFLSILSQSADEAHLLDLFKRQYALPDIVGRTLRDVEFEGVRPVVWWPRQRSSGVLIDPRRSFGQPIERVSHIPAKVLADAAIAEGSLQAAARVWDVPLQAVARATAFQRGLAQQAA